MAKPKTITSWSPSRLACYQECPRKAKYKFVDKLKEPQGPAASRGEEIHATLESFVKGETKSYHEAVKPAHKNTKAVLTRLRKGFKEGLVSVELELAFDREWRPTDYDYKNTDVWARFKLDILEYTDSGAHVIDWKSGKVREGGSYDDQLNAYAVAAMSSMDGLPYVETTLAFVDHDLLLSRPAGVLHAKDLKQRQDMWTRAVKLMMTDTTFREHPQVSCRWCAFSKAKGGPCRY